MPLVKYPGERITSHRSVHEPSDQDTYRIVSLIPSASEILALLGFERQIVGRSHECDYPEVLREVPACSSSAVDKHASSREIDKKVKYILIEALSMYQVDTELLDKLAPTHIVTQSQCEVCAVSLAQVQWAVNECLRSHPKIVSLEAKRLEDIWRDIQSVASALEVPARGQKAVSALRARVQAIGERCQSIPSLPSVACIEWIDPLMFAGHWIPELVELAGGSAAWGSAGWNSDYLDIQDLLASDPDVIVVMPCGFDVARSLKEMPALAARTEWQALRAVESGQVFVVDGNHYFNRPGPRIVESTEILAEILHPEAFDFGHQGSGWMRLSDGR